VTEEPRIAFERTSTESKFNEPAAAPTVFMDELKVLSSDGTYLEGVAASTFRYKFAKRFIDMALSILMIVLLAPLFLVIAILVRMSSPGSVFYTERRVGRFGRHFVIYKFRTMYTKEYMRNVLNYHENEKELLRRRVEHKHVHDPRITRVGAVLRKLSLDELPQLFNVLKGDMSLVGPRPIVDAELVNYGGYAIFYKLVYPGLSGLWQVSGRNDVSYKTRVRLDVTYCRKWNLLLDIVILARTLPAVLKKKGAY